MPAVRLVGAPLRQGRARGPVRFAGTSPPDAERGAILAAATLEEALGRFAAGDGVGIVIEAADADCTHLLSTGPPVVERIDRDLLRDGEVVEVDGGAGTVELPRVAEVRVVTSFLERSDGRILLLRRSERVGSFRGHWAGVSGFLETPRPIDQAYREIAEETGIRPDALALAAEGRTVYARDADRIYAIQPFRFRVGSVAVRLDWEHTEFDWVDPEEIGHRPTVPKLDRVWAAVAPSPAPSAARKKR